MPSSHAKPKSRPSPVGRIANIGSLKRFPDREYANDLLHQAAKLVAPIMHENNFNVETLCEMYPKSGNLLGLNVNKGQKILLRLRYHSNDRLFLPMGDIVGTLLHELTHNLYGAHDHKFYEFLDGLKKRFEEIQVDPSSTTYVAIEEKLGGRGDPRFINEKRVAKLGKGIYKAERRRLGSTSRVEKPKLREQIREAMIRAAERRLRDLKWCSNHEDEQDSDLEIIEMRPDSPSKIKERVKSNPILREYLDVIDLTEEDTDGDKVPVVVIDALEQNELLPPLEPKTATVPKQTEPEEEIQYTLSSSPGRTFIFEDSELPTPRYKLVADMNFDQILRRADKLPVKVKKAAKARKKPKPKAKAVKPKDEPPRKTVKCIGFEELFKTEL